ncbi:MAG: DNA primase [Chloroflexi bacterium]|nr:DNA primase [Chloroflexota bacterium]MDA1269795.1 DNA primase [Chloroflexota bacterium]PKB58448.1 MAG: DNA primase [SAR202 cluster bacterium Casp-Chloro-G2]
MTVVDDVKSRLDIVEVVSQRVALQRSGRSYKANCPFHQEKSPSFHVFPDRQSWRCFGACATGGDVLSFVMRAENLEFGEALRQLAQQTGVTLPKRGQNPREEAAHKINEDARAYFQRTLASAQGASAREYLEGRKMDKKAVEAFEVGLSPNDGESLKNHLTREGYSLEQLASAGVVRTGDDGLVHDQFRGRLMFPIRDVHGNLVGFGARTLDGSEPKYLNSQQGPLFDKSRLLYSMDRARTEVRKQGAVIVEGYMDAIAAHQAGFTNVVAQMGTALTEFQVDEIRRLTGKMTMALDQDAAGQAATLRSLDVILESFRTKVSKPGPDGSPQSADPDLRIIVMPPGQDPDDVIHRSPSDWARLVETAIPAYTFRLNAIIDQGDVATPEGKAEIVARCAPIVHLVGEGIQQASAIELLATKLGVPIDTVKAALSRPSVARRTRRPEQQRRAAATSSPFAKLDHDPIEEHCLQLLLGHPELRELAQGLRPEFFRRHENRELFSRWLDAGTGMDKDEIVASIKRSGDDEVSAQLNALLSKPVIPLDFNGRTSSLKEVTSRLEERNLRILKSEEVIRFSESPPDLEDGEHGDILRLNEQIKKNEGLRRGQVQEISG